MVDAGGIREAIEVKRDAAMVAFAFIGIEATKFIEDRLLHGTRDGVEEMSSVFPRFLAGFCFEDAQPGFIDQI